MSKHNEELHAVPSLLELAEQLENKAAEEEAREQTQDKEEDRTVQQTGEGTQPEDTDKNDQAPQSADEDTRLNDHAEQSTHGEPDKTSEKPAPASEDAKQTNRVSAGVASTEGVSETSIVPPKTKAEAYTLAKIVRTFKVFIGVRFFFLLLPLLALLVATVSGVVFPAPIIFAYPILLLLSLGQLDKGRVAVNVAANILTLLSLPFLWGITMSLYKIFMTPGIMLCAFELFCAVYSLVQAPKISKGYIQLGEGGRHLYEKYVTAEDLPRETSLSNITPPTHPDTPEKPAENPEEGTKSSSNTAPESTEPTSTDAPTGPTAPAVTQSDKPETEIPETHDKEPASSDSGEHNSLLPGIPVVSEHLVQQAQRSQLRPQSHPSSKQHKTHDH
ncbi:hypothetical protein [Rothia aeria]|uniref:hypothetical protein n=1 Tax=Rothia aeria TaxID=172042 RepID=UPI0028D295A4|nr:hypothetical protein [Rothia aeria]